MLAYKREYECKYRPKICNFTLSVVILFMSNLLKHFFFCILILCFFCTLTYQVKAQNTNANTKALFLKLLYKDTSNIMPAIPTTKTFANINSVQTYIAGLPTLLISKGYIAASIDSAWQIVDTIYLSMHIGKRYQWLQLRTSGLSKNILLQIGYDNKSMLNKPINFAEIETLKEKLLKIYERQGYPFAKVYLDSIKIIDTNVTAILTANTLQLYPIDSIKNYGKLKFAPAFIQNYLGIKNGSYYNYDKLSDVDRRLKELPYVDIISPSSLKMLTTGATLNLFVNARRSSEASAIIGFLPDANGTGKLQITGDVNIDLKNVFGGGEGLVFKFQALQPQSNRLIIGLDKPYIFRSPFGTGFLFELFKKDSTFLQVGATLHAQYNLSTYQTGKLIVQFQSNNILPGGIDSASIKAQKLLPNIIDVAATNVGINYEYRKTNYRFNPIKGNEVAITSILGIKKIEKNADIISLTSPGFNYASLYDSIALSSYQLRVKLQAAHYFPLSKVTTIKGIINAGLYSSPTIFRNEVFQIGGYKLLRGFDEESIYATKYAVATAEFRALISADAYFFTFVDAALVNAKYQSVKASNNFLSAGAGLYLQTKAGLLNLSLAIGKRNDLVFNIRQAAKIHFGYINYF